MGECNDFQKEKKVYFGLGQATATGYVWIVIPSKALDFVVLLSSRVSPDSVTLGVRKQPKVFSCCFAPSTGLEAWCVLFLVTYPLGITPFPRVDGGDLSPQ